MVMDKTKGGGVGEGTRIQFVASVCLGPFSYKRKNVLNLSHQRSCLVPGLLACGRGTNIFCSPPRA